MKVSKLIKAFVLLITVTVLTTFVPVNVTSQDTVVYAAKKTEVKINNGKFKKIVVGKTVTLKVKGAKKVKWYASTKNHKVVKTNVIKLSQKKNRSVKVKAKKAGRCYLLAKVGEKYYSCRIVVVPKTSSTTNKKKNSYTDYELYLMSHLINAEAGSSWISDEEQRAVGSVVLNRVKDSRFPNTMEGVIYQRGQYSCTWDGNFAKQPSARAIKNAKYVLENGPTIPENVVFQAQFVQGKGIWKKLGNHYFCY